MVYRTGADSVQLRFYHFMVFRLDILCLSGSRACEVVPELLFEFYQGIQTSRGSDQLFLSASLFRSTPDRCEIAVFDPPGLGNAVIHRIVSF